MNERAESGLEYHSGDIFREKYIALVLAIFTS
jgi:hypothetical protein